MNDNNTGNPVAMPRFTTATSIGTETMTASAAITSIASRPCGLGRSVGGTFTTNSMVVDGVADRPHWKSQQL